MIKQLDRLPINPKKMSDIKDQKAKKGPRLGIWVKD